MPAALVAPAGSPSLGNETPPHEVAKGGAKGDGEQRRSDRKGGIPELAPDELFLV